MNEIRIGSASEFIKIEMPSVFSSEGWAQASVEIKTSHFHGALIAWVEDRDFSLFENSLSILYHTLKGVASFETTEGQITFKLEAKSGGQIEMSGIAWSEACYGSRLEFEISLDQTFLQEPLNKLEAYSFASKAKA
jgi:hypothetical protein